MGVESEVELQLVKLTAFFVLSVVNAFVSLFLTKISKIVGGIFGVVIEIIIFIATLEL